jgi:hypothetical protein
MEEGVPDKLAMLFHDLYFEEARKERPATHKPMWALVMPAHKRVLKVTLLRWKEEVDIREDEDSEERIDKPSYAGLLEPGVKDIVKSRGCPCGGEPIVTVMDEYPAMDVKVVINCHDYSLGTVLRRDRVNDFDYIKRMIINTIPRFECDKSKG